MLSRTFVFRLNRTNMGLTGSHGAYISNKTAINDLFELSSFVDGTYKNIQYSFFDKREYYFTLTPHSYQVSLEATKTGEGRITSLKEVFSALKITETDYLVIESVDISSNRVFLFDKVTKEGHLVFEKGDITGKNVFWSWNNSLAITYVDTISNIVYPCTIIKQNNKSFETSIKLVYDSTLNVHIGDSNSTQTESHKAYKIQYLEGTHWIDFNFYDLVLFDKEGDHITLSPDKTKTKYCKYIVETL